MIKNYVKIAFRNLWRHKSFTVINVAGLAIATASCLLLFTVIKYELSYDTFQPNYDKMYHAVSQDKYDDGITHNPGVPVPALKDKYSPVLSDEMAQKFFGNDNPVGKILVADDTMQLKVHAC